MSDMLRVVYGSRASISHKLDPLSLAQASFRCEECTGVYMECSSCYHQGSSLWSLVPVDVQSNMLKIANRKRDQAVVRELLQVPVQHKRLTQ